MPEISINRLAILGVGLIGGSLARALRRAGVCTNIIGFGRNEEHLQKAVQLGVIDEYALDAARTVSDADVIVLATPLATTQPLLSRIRDSIKENAIVTDVGSAKGSIVAIAREVFNAKQLRNFIPGHPVAGTEKSGVEASFAELFEDHLLILTPLSESDKHSVDFVARMWEATGAKVVTMDVSHHDEVLAATSHLPHMLAYALVNCLAGMQERDEIFKYAAGGFADFTRIASSSPQMWHDICFSNRVCLLQMLDHFGAHLSQIRNAIEHDDSHGLLEMFTSAKKARDEFIKSHGKMANTVE
ncbi:MAG: prephenate dehydrogenase [Gammaproteobacteria bacterium]